MDVTMPLVTSRPCRDRSSSDCVGFIEPGRAANSTRCLNCAAQRTTKIKRTHGFHRGDSVLMRFLRGEQGAGIDTDSLPGVRGRAAVGSAAASSPRRRVP